MEIRRPKRSFQHFGPLYKRRGKMPIGTIEDNDADMRPCLRAEDEICLADD